MILCAELSAITKTGSQKRSDQNIQIALGLERKLRCLMQLDARVHISDDLLQLFGTVSSWHQKQQAQELIREFAPQYRIRNEIVVRPATLPCSNRPES